MSTRTRVVAYLGGLALLFVAATGIGRAVGPVEAVADDHGHAPTGSDPMVGTDHEPVPGGVLTSEDGYTLHLADSRLPAGAARPLAFTIGGPDGAPVTSYDVVHDKLLHLVVVRRDFSGFQHVHPTMTPDGTWSAPVDLTPGSWRVFADFTATGGPALVLGADLAVPGPTPAAADLPPTRTATVDGYTVTLAGDLAAGTHSMLTLTVSRDGAPVTDLEPYLGAYGHLVALREGDLAYLHVHPEDGPAGPDLTFGAEVPSAGRFHLYLDFQHGGVVHTTAFVVDATSATSTEGAGHDDH